jgi:hypothetical protein
VKQLSCFFLVLLAAATARGAQVTFTVDPAQSSLAIASSTSVFGSPLPTTAQAAGSLLAAYSGSIVAEVTPGTIQIQSGSSLTAGNSGNWLPGTDYSSYPADLDDPNGYISTPVPANYGILTDLTSLGAVLGKQGVSPSAIRGLVIGLVDSSPKMLTAGTFDEAGTNTDFTAGTVFYSSGGSPPITDLANTVNPDSFGDAAGQGTLVQLGDTLTLTIPVSFAVNYNVNFLAVSTTYTGTIVATALVPEPAGYLLLASGAAAVFVAKRRFRTR